MTTSYAERARRFLSDRAGSEADGERSEESEVSGVAVMGEARWQDRMPAGSAPILHLPPRVCIGPSACARLGPCERHVAGRPCLVAP